MVVIYVCLRYSRPLLKNSLLEDVDAVHRLRANRGWDNSHWRKSVAAGHYDSLLLGPSGSLRLNLTQHGKTYQVQT